MRKNLRSKIAAFAILFGGFVTAAQAQVTTSAMYGSVAETSGRTIAGASVQVIHIPTGTTYNTQTRADGRFNLPNLRVGGPYKVKVSFVGMNDFTLEDINLNLGQEFAVNAKLQSNTVSLNEVVIKSTQSKVFNSSRTGSRETVNRAQIEALPTIGRSLSDYTKLTPSANGNSFGGRSSSYNNLTVDGAMFNNSFGLSGSLGGQTSSQPISLDAIEQIQVDIAPYDVRQGFFTGAGVNTVTKSGTNDVKGSAYFYFRNPGSVGLKAGPFENLRQDFTYNTRGFSLGGPIIKNKLFFFFSGEQERQSRPATTFIAAANGVAGGAGNVSSVKVSDLDKLKKTLIEKYSYNPGEYQGYNNDTQSDKITFKLDYNINKNHTLSAKYFYFKSFAQVAASNSGSIQNSSRAPGLRNMPFSGSGYVINNNFNIAMVELNSRFSNKFANKLSVGYTALRDFRESRSNAFPMVDIGTANNITSFGYEPFTANNKLNTDTYQLTNDFTAYFGKHEVTVGTANQFNSFVNGFAPNYNGIYQFNSIDDFVNGNPATRYQYRYSALPDGEFPYARLKSLQFSLYAQDKFSVTNNFKLTYGIRADYNTFINKLEENKSLANLKFKDGADDIQIDVSQFPTAKILFSPRVGFNYNLNGEGNTQFRGGAGIFTGQVPFVWLSNQASNNGVQFGSYDIDVTKGASAADPRLVFQSDVNKNRPANGVANTSYNVAVTAKDFKMPQVFRINGAVDQKLPYGLVATLEGVYTKDINAVLFQNINLDESKGTKLLGSDERVRYANKQIYATGKTLENPTITDAILFKNTSKGYSYFVTGQLQKTFASGFMASVAYTYSKAKSVNDGGSIAKNIWRDRSVTASPNADELGYANFFQPHRIISFVSYRKEYAKNYATSVGLTFESAAAGNYSVTYKGDVNNDGETNDLMYVPKDASDIVLVKDFKEVKNGLVVQNSPADTRTTDQIWNQLNNFINQDSYLSKNRGSVVERGAALLPYFKQFNLNFTQDFYVNIKGGKRNTLRFTVDIINLGNLLNRDWGLYYNSTVEGRQPLAFKGMVVAQADANKSITGDVVNVGDPRIGKPAFSFPYADGENAIPATVSNSINTNSLWQAQFGIRYIFN
ncbi:MAG: TonB-dependent receptor [Sphingobacteriaceae bacterium]|nr:TonB-dependent receptor [Sphingobacteriaceae bacterium]